MTNETERIRDRYSARNLINDPRYDPLLPSVYMAQQEKERALVRLLRAELGGLRDKSVLEIGCGSGLNLLQLIRLGFSPENLWANELLEERLAVARRNLPAGVKLVGGDASALDIPDGSFDMVYQSTVFSSILDDAFQANLAARMWRLLKPGGGILWYDFIYDNPKNRDVRGVSYRRMNELFPDGVMTKYRVTLAPPVSRVVTRIHPSLYAIFNVFPVLRTHLLCWIGKRDA